MAGTISKHVHINTLWTISFALYAGVALAASVASATSVWLCLHSGPDCHQCLPDHRAAQRPGEGHTGKQEWQVPICLVKHMAMQPRLALHGCPCMYGIRTCTVQRLPYGWIGLDWDNNPSCVTGFELHFGHIVVHTYVHTCCRASD